MISWGAWLRSAAALRPSNSLQPWSQALARPPGPWFDSTAASQPGGWQKTNLRAKSCLTSETWPVARRHCAIKAWPGGAQPQLVQPAVFAVCTPGSQPGKQPIPDNIRLQIVAPTIRAVGWAGEIRRRHSAIGIEASPTFTDKAPPPEITAPIRSS